MPVSKQIIDIILLATNIYKITLNIFLIDQPSCAVDYLEMYRVDCQRKFIPRLHSSLQYLNKWRLKKPDDKSHKLLPSFLHLNNSDKVQQNNEHQNNFQMAE